MEEEVHIKKSGPSGWDTPENVERIISAAPGLIAGMIAQSQESNKAAIQAADVMHRRVVWLAVMICFAVAGTGALAAWMGRFDVAEKLLIPLLSFVGGIGLATRTK
jgi:hypothetical protein